MRSALEVQRAGGLMGLSEYILVTILSISQASSLREECWIPAAGACKFLRSLYDVEKYDTWIELLKVNDESAYEEELKSNGEITRKRAYELCKELWLPDWWLQNEMLTERFRSCGFGGFTELELIDLGVEELPSGAIFIPHKCCLQHDCFASFALTGIGHFWNLKELNLSECCKLQSLPESQFHPSSICSANDLLPGAVMII
jgi:hypothetical protein